MSESLWAIVPAAGKGLRAGASVPKQFRSLAGKAVLEWTVERLLEVPEVCGVIVAMPPEGFGPSAGSDIGAGARSRLHLLGATDRPVIQVLGGATRQESVRRGLAVLPTGVSWVVVHDASRPCFSRELFNRVLDAALAHKAAVPALKPTNTVKSIRRGEAEGSLFVQSTLDREALAEVQTPQIFDAALLRSAHDAALERGADGTDDSMLVEALGHPVAVVPGERQNLKITYREDLERAERTIAKGLDSQPESPQPGGEWTTVTGLGFDLHPLVAGRECVLGGVTIPFDRGPLGHSDGDLVCHSIMDAILGALGEGDIGVHFPDSDPRYKGASSVHLMKELWSWLSQEARMVHIDVTVIAETPRISPHSTAMKEAIGGALGVSPNRVSIKATTTEKLGTLGRGEGIACLAVATLQRPLPCAHQ